MNNTINNIKYAFRMMRKHVGFTVIALVTLMIGIGTNTFTFTLLNILFLRPIQVDRVEELAVCEAENVDFFFNYAPYRSLRENNPVFTDLAAVSVMTVDVTFTRTDRAGLARTTPAYCVFLRIRQCPGPGSLVSAGRGTIRGRACGGPELSGMETLL